MSRQCAYSRLRLLTNAPFRLYTAIPEQEKASIPREREKDLLISLHQVLSEIQLLKQAADGEFGSETDSEAEEKRSFCQCEDDCVKRIVADMVCMLGTGSEFVQHSVVNVVVTLSELMAESEKDWETFISSLNGYLRTTMLSSLSCSSTSSNIDSLESTGVISSDLVNVNWLVACSIIQIYRKILKILKQDYEEKLIQVYLKHICSWLSYVPRSSIGDIHVDQNTDDDHPKIYGNRVLGPKLKMLLLGNLLQLLCSLVDQDYCSESATSVELRHQVLSKIQNLVPLISSWCLQKQRNVCSSLIHHYFKHKLLVLMMRLVAENSTEQAIFHSFLELLHECFEDVLNQKLTLVVVADSSCLVDSPFLHSTFDEEGVCKASQQHLQRLAILLFLKCTVTMITSGVKQNLLCVCANSLTNADLKVRCCDARSGIVELYIWLSGQHPIDSYMDCDMYAEKCVTFSSLLLQLFVNEDDMLFQALLQVFNLPSSTTHQFLGDKFSFPEAKCDIVFHISNIFNPMLLFHIFLSKLHYDHQILLDYLISKDSGLSCAEYLLRCLGKVSESWKAFVNCSFENISIQSNKRRKIATAKMYSKDGGETFVLWERGKGQKTFEQAKQCLVSLRVSVESLHQRRLFPYNAEVLLKRPREP